MPASSSTTRPRSSFRLAEQKETCRRIEGIIEADELAREAEMAPVRPGGPDNPDKGLRGWFRWTYNLGRFMGRSDRRHGASDVASALADPPVLAALAGDPVSVRVLGVDGKPETLLVYPKSLEANFHIHYRDYLLGWLTEKLALLRESHTADDVNVMGSVVAEIAYQYQAICWILTSEGPRLPFDHIKDPTPEIPERWRDLSEFTALAILSSQKKLAERLTLTRDLLSADPASPDAPRRRPSWSMLIATQADEQKISAGILIRDRSLAEVLSTMILSSGAKREAYERAKAESERRAGASEFSGIGS